MQRNPEQELLEMMRRQGGAPPAGGPMDVGGPMPEPQMPMGQAPEGMPPMPEGPMPGGPMPGGPPPPPGMEPGMEQNIPTEAMVLSIEGEEVTLETNTGEVINLPMAAFPVDPEVGMTLESAEVVMVSNGTVIANVGIDNVEVELETDMLQMPFNVGDMFWMPTSPVSPEAMAGPAPGGLDTAPPIDDFEG